MSEAQKGIPKGVTINLGSAGLAYTTSEGDQVVSVKKSELDAKSEEFESVSISLKRLREENAALSERLKAAEDLINEISGDVAFFEHAAKQYIKVGREKQNIIKVGTPVRAIKRRIEAYLSKTPKKGNT